jgi:HSP20 family molecular chaperone IbpA
VFDHLYQRTSEVDYQGRRLVVHHLTAEQYSEYRRLSEEPGNGLAASKYIVGCALPGVDPAKLPISTLKDLTEVAASVLKDTAGDEEERAKN